MNNNNINPPNLSIDNISLLPPEYKRAVKVLSKKLTKTLNNAIRIRLLRAFSEKYTTLPGIWRFWYSSVFDHRYQTINLNYGVIYKAALKHFPQQENKEWPFLNDINQIRRFASEEIKNQMKPYLLLPHSKLSYAFDKYSENDDETENIMEKYKMACEIYEEMISIDLIKDGDKFVEALKKTDNDEFVVTNIECKLAQNPWSQKLWKAYIEYLEKDKKDDMALLQVLSRYCRLFIGDKKMKKRYQKKIEELSESLVGISEYWIDSIKFEIQFSSIIAATDLLNKALNLNICEMMKFFDKALDLAEQFRKIKMMETIEEAKKLYLKEHPEMTGYNFKKVIKNLSFHNVKMQYLPFSSSVSRYIYDNVNSQHLQKLYQTCKWFYFKYRLNIVHKYEDTGGKIIKGFNGRSVMIPSFQFTKNSIALSSWNLSRKECAKVKNLWITHSMIFQARNTSVLKRIKRVNLKYLSLNATRLTEKEFEMLTESKTIEKFHWVHGRTPDDIEFELEDILQKLPKLRVLDIWCNIKAVTAEKLQEIKFQKKLERFHLCYRGTMNAEPFYIFLLKNLAPNSTLILYDMDHSPQEAVNKAFFTQNIAEWQPKNEKPNFYWGYV